MSLRTKIEKAIKILDKPNSIDPRIILLNQICNIFQEELIELCGKTSDNYAKTVSEFDSLINSLDGERKNKPLGG